MAEGKKNLTYKIIIDTKGAKPKSETPTEPEEEQSPSIIDQLLSVKNSIKGVAEFAIVTGVAKQAFSWGASIVGRQSGNSIVQERLDTTISLATQAVAVGGGFIASAATGNVVGMIASTGAMISMMMDKLREVEENAYKKGFEQTELLLQRERGGAALNRSRI